MHGRVRQWLHVKNMKIDSNPNVAAPYSGANIISRHICFLSYNIIIRVVYFVFGMQINTRMWETSDIHLMIVKGSLPFIVGG